MSALMKIAQVMNCNIGEMMDFTPDEVAVEQQMK